jgi:putative tryptophan/tyrosine transport system substrate-binding protein
VAFDIGKRQFISALGAAAVARPLTAVAQATDRIRRIGFLNTSAEDDVDAAQRFAAFKLKLQELGWIEGKTLRIDIRFGGNSGEQVRQAASALIALAPDAIVSTTSITTRALTEATGAIPIVAAVSGDPIALGFTKSLSSPTLNVTGFTTFNDILAAKRFEMLREIVPAMHNAALMWNPLNPQQVLLEAQTGKAAQALGIELLSLPIKAVDDIAPALAMAHSQNASALIVAADPLTTGNGRAIVEGCIALKIPAMHTYASEAKNGALIAYGIDLVENYRRTAEYIDRILRGAKIADLPFQEPTRLTLAINLQTAHAIGIDVPPTLLAIADLVIE